MARPSTGFTLIEVLVALAVLALVFALAYRAPASGFDWLDRGDREQTAVLLARSTLARVGQDIALEDGETRGRTSDGFTWVVEKAPYGDSSLVHAGQLVGHQVQVTVSWTGRYRRHSVRLTTVRLGLKVQGS